MLAWVQPALYTSVVGLNLKSHGRSGSACWRITKFVSPSPRNRKTTLLHCNTSKPRIEIRIHSISWPWKKAWYSPVCMSSKRKESNSIRCTCSTGCQPCYVFNNLWHGIKLLQVIPKADEQSISQSPQTSLTTSVYNLIATPPAAIARFISQHKSINTPLSIALHSNRGELRVYSNPTSKMTKF